MGSTDSSGNESSDSEDERKERRKTQKIEYKPQNEYGKQQFKKNL